MRQVGGGCLWELMEGRREEDEMTGEEAAVNTLSLEGRGTGTVSRGLAGAPSLALQTLAFISGQKGQWEVGQPCSTQLEVMSILKKRMGHFRHFRIVILQHMLGAVSQK